jgi:hypothetical protein
MTEDSVVDLNTEILIGIREEIRGVRADLRAEIRCVRDDLGGEIRGLRDEVGGLRDEVGGLRGEVRGLGTKLETLEAETIRGFTAVRGELTMVNRRLDNLIEVAGAGHRDHEGRIAALETTVAALRHPSALR